MAEPAAGAPLKVLVTGANGFVGRAVCRELSMRGHQLRRALRTAKDDAGEAGEVVSVGALSGNTDWSSAVAGMDAVVHLAARVHVMRETASDAAAAFRSVNVAATVALAQAAVDHRVKRLVFVSSVKVNGEATAREPFRPTDAARPLDPYGVSKWEAEQSLWRIARSSGLQVVVVRPPLVYGPEVKGNFLRLLKLARSGVPLPLGALDNRRSMIYVANLASALVNCVVHDRAAGRTFLASDGEDVSTTDLVRRLAIAMGIQPRLFGVSPRLLRAAAALVGKTAEIDRLAGSLAVDSSALRETLDWSAPFSLDAGLRETARWFCSGTADAR